jgi:hypothetical protein
VLFYRGPDLVAFTRHRQGFRKFDLEGLCCQGDNFVENR